jgi:hypothetical protein
VELKVGFSDVTLERTAAVIFVPLMVAVTSDVRLAFAAAVNLKLVIVDDCRKFNPL